MRCSYYTQFNGVYRETLAWRGGGGWSKGAKFRISFEVNKNNDISFHPARETNSTRVNVPAPSCMLLHGELFAVHTPRASGISVGLVKITEYPKTGDM